MVWYGDLSSLLQAQNIRASWSLAVVFALCSSATFGPVKDDIAVNSLMSVWCGPSLIQHDRTYSTEKIAKGILFFHCMVVT